MGKFAINCMRFFFGLMYLLGGGVKTQLLGKLFAPEIFGHVSDAFAAAHEVLSISNSLTPMQFQEVVGYTEMLCGFMFLTGQLMALSAIVLMLINSVALYALFLLKQPFYSLAASTATFIGLLSFVLVLNSSKKQKKA